MWTHSRPSGRRGGKFARLLLVRLPHQELADGDLVAAALDLELVAHDLAGSVCGFGSVGSSGEVRRELAPAGVEQGGELVVVDPLDRERKCGDGIDPPVGAPSDAWLGALVACGQAWDLTRPIRSPLELEARRLKRGKLRASTSPFGKLRTQPDFV